MAELLLAKDIRFAYGQTPALRGLDVALEAGEFAALIGPNGSGKSTLIKCLLGHLRADGNIAWNGRSVGHWRKRDLARLVAYLPQSPHYEPGQSVLDVLRLGRAPYWGAFGLESSADQAVIDQVATTLGLEPLLGRRMDQLSGGQRQIVFVGRCLAQQPKALVLDEPNTFLDMKHQVDLCRLLKTLARDSKLGVLIASHELNVCGAWADRLLLLDEGKLAATGTPAEVLKPEILAAVYKVGIERFQGSGQNPVVAPIIQR